MVDVRFGGSNDYGQEFEVCAHTHVDIGKKAGACAGAGTRPRLLVMPASVVLCANAQLLCHLPCVAFVWLLLRVLTRAVSRLNWAGFRVILNPLQTMRAGLHQELLGKATTDAPTRKEGQQNHFAFLTAATASEPVCAFESSQKAN